MTSLGDTLRRERLKRHLDLDQISRELKISARMLEAIEEEKFERLPGGVFTKSFVRQYARALGLDEEEIASQAEQLIESPFSIQVLAHAEPVNSAPIHVPKVEPWESFGEKNFSWGSWMPAAAMVIVAMLVCSAIYGWWQRGRRIATPESNTPAVEIARADAPPATVPAQPPATQGSDTQPTATHPSATPPPVEPSAAQPSTQPNPAGADAGQPAAPVSQIPVRPVNPNAAVRVAMTADDMVWISARADGKYLFSGVMTANETRTVEANDTVVVRLGNAGGLHVTLNGKPVGTLGAKGQPRTVQFTPGGFQIVAAPKPSLPL